MKKKPPEVFYKKTVLKNFAMFKGILYLQAFRPTTLSKRGFTTGVFL